MESRKRKNFQIKAKVPNVKIFIEFRDGLTNISREAFTINHEKMLDLLFVPGQKEAITTLVQFYDPPLRCFLFQGFQLAPTIEEFRRILDSPKEKKGIYRGMRKYPKPKDLVEVLNTLIADLALNIKT
ncbi:unnamed protein product [Lathyrus sativus]|nr:unnamed protein product [Lathyrus sativus]